MFGYAEPLSCALAERASDVHFKFGHSNWGAAGGGRDSDQCVLLAVRAAVQDWLPAEYSVHSHFSADPYGQHNWQQAAC